MNRPAVCIALVLATQAFAARVPAGTDLSVRLGDKIATETTKPSTAIHATVIAPIHVTTARPLTEPRTPTAPGSNSG